MDLHDKYFLVTGANGNLGFEITKSLLKQNAKVCIACRSLAVAESTKSLLLENFAKAEIQTLALPLDDLVECKSSLVDMLQNIGQIHGIFNNAGIHISRYDKRIKNKNFLTKQGFELHFQINYLAPVLITELCQPSLADQARVVHVFSKDYTSVKGLDISDVRENKLSASGHPEYARSKLALALYQQWSLHKSPNIKSFLASPGVTKTKLWDNVPKLILWFKKFHSVQAGVVPIMQCLDLQESEIGCFIGYSEDYGWQAEGLNHIATNVELQQSLWEQTQIWLKDI